jgi:hypothetical protein
MCLIVSWCVGSKWDIAGNDEYRGRSRRLGAKDRGWSGTSLGHSVARRSGGRLTPCVIRIVHVEKMRSVGFPVWASKLVATTWWFGPQNHRDGFLVWVSKPRGGGLSICASKPMSRWRWCEDTHRHLVACFIHIVHVVSWRKSDLGFPVLPRNWWNSDNGWCTWYHCGGRVKVKQKTVGLMMSDVAQ